MPSSVAVMNLIENGRNLGYSGTGASDASTATARLTGKLRY